MDEAVLKISSLYIYGFGLLTVLSFLWGAFVFYKKSLESHFEDLMVLDCVILSGFWAFIIGRLVFVALNLSTFWNHFPRILLLTNYPGVDRWGAIAGIALGVLLSVRKTKARFFDWFDLVSLGILSAIAVFLSGLFLFTRSFGYLGLSFLNLLLFLYLWNVEDKYRTFDWYRGKRTSAKSGFISGMVVSSFGLSYAFEEFLFGGVSTWGLIWGSCLFVCGLVLVYIRSGRTVAEDIKNIFKHGQK